MTKSRSLADRLLEIAERLVSTNAIRARQLEEIGIDVGHLESERDEAHELISGFDSEISSGNVPDRLGDLLEKLRSGHEPSAPVVCRQCGSTDTMPWPTSPPHPGPSIEKAFARSPRIIPPRDFDIEAHRGLYTEPTLQCICDPEFGAPRCPVHGPSAVRT